MIRLLFAALLALSMFGQNPNTAQFPTAVTTDQYVLAAKRLSESSLNGSINASTTTVVVSDGTQFLNWQIVRIDSEEMLIQSVSSNTLTIVSGGRGYNGTTAASHTTGAAVRGIITSWHHNQLAAEVKAIETRLRNVTGQCSDSGSTDDYACSPAPPFTSYSTGMIVNFKANTANTGAATANFNSIGATAIKKVAGGVTTALDTNDIRAGQWVTVVYDGTNFQMISALGNASSSGSGISSCVPTSASGTAYVCTASPTVSSLTVGLTLAFKPDVSSSGSATLNVSGLGVVQLFKTLPQSTVQIGNADLIADTEYLIVYDGTRFWVLGVDNAAYNYIMEEGSAVTQRTVLNMIGAGVTCVDNSGSGRTDCTIPADAVKAGSNTWSGANDFSGATSFIARFGTTAAASGDCDASGERGNVYVQTGDPASVATRVSVCTQTGASSYAWMPISHKVGTTAPATCAVGEIFFDSDATAGSNWFGCTSSNTWTLMSGTAGLADPGSNGMLARTASNTTAARTLIGSDSTVLWTNPTGASGNPDATVNPALVLLRSTDQSGANRSCVSASASDDYKCDMTPVLSAYSTRMVVEFTPTVVGNTGAAKLEINSLGSGTGKDIKLCDGTTDPATGDIAVGKQVALRYDGTVFRLPCNPATISAGTGDALTTNPLSQFAATTSAQLRGVLSDETGTGAGVFATSPTVTTPTVAGMTGTGVIDLSGATSAIMVKGTSAPSSGACDAAAEEGSIYVRTGDPASVPSQVYMCAKTGASSWAWHPISHKVGATDPATCDEGNIFYNTTSDTLRVCTAANTWGAIGGSSGPSITQGVYSSLPGTCATGDVYYYTNAVFTHARCSAANTWSNFYHGKLVMLPPAVASGWTTQTTNNGGGTYTFTDTQGSVRLTSTTGTASKYIRSLPATPDFTVSVCALTSIGETNSSFYIGLSDGTSNTAWQQTMYADHGSGNVTLRWQNWKFWSYDAGAATLADFQNPEHICYQVKQLSGTRTYSTSLDGTNWFERYSTTSTTFITPTHYWIAIKGAGDAIVYHIDAQ